ncbi:lamin tail domain-containing protein [Thermodesulfobacteriota bacterium]
MNKNTACLTKTVLLMALIGCGVLLLCGSAGAALFFSEYVEGSSLNRALEIYNPDGAAVDLGSGAYRIEIYRNGSASPNSSISLSGTIAAGGVFVISHLGADAAVLAVADQTANAVHFTGDDAIVLRQGGASGTVLDVIGQVGIDPGSRWGTEPVTTSNHTLRRLPSVTSGDTDGGDAFDPADEWFAYDQDIFDGLGYSGLETAVALVYFSALPGSQEVMLVWETGSEEENAGFNLYRAEAENGPYEQINPRLIPSEVGTGLGALYVYVDEAVRNRKTYYYLLEDVDVHGTATDHGPAAARPLWVYGREGLRQ